MYWIICEWTCNALYCSEHASNCVMKKYIAPMYIDYSDQYQAF